MDFELRPNNSFGIMHIPKTPALMFEFNNIEALNVATHGQNSTSFLHPYTAVEQFFHILEYAGYFHRNLVEYFMNVDDVAGGGLTLRKDEKY